MTSNLAHIGNQTTFYPYENERGEINVVSGSQAVGQRILHVLLTRPGEDPLHPNWGIAPDLFKPQNQDTAIAFAYQVQQILIRLNKEAKIGFEALQVEVDDTGIATGHLKIKIMFRAVGAPYNNVLTFGFWEYQQSVLDNNLEAFVKTLEIL